MQNFFTIYKSPLSVLIFLILLSGIFCYTRLESSLFPEVTFPKIKVIADAGEQPVDQMQLNVTRPIENSIKQVPDITDIRSTTSRGSCEISAFVNWNADIDITQQHIESKINQIKNSLPDGVNITVEKMNPSILPVMGFTLRSNSLSPIELKSLANYTIKPFLSQVNGVSEVRVIGGKDKEYQLTLDADKLKLLGVSPDMLSAALKSTNFIQSIGYLTDFDHMYLTVGDMQLDSKSELENCVIYNNGKRTVTVHDIAQISIVDAKEFVKINANGDDAILVAIVKQPNTNVIAISDNIISKIEELKSMLPSGVQLTPYYDQADFVNDSIKSVKDSLWIGIVLAIIVAIIFLHSLKASMVILISVPVTLLFTIVILYATGQTLNIMTLGAIAAAIGLIIDDAIVVVEQIHRTHEEHPKEPSQMLVQKAIKYLFPAMVGSSLSTIVIFLPFVMMSGVAGAYFKVMTNTMMITLICSFIVTWIFLPVIYLLLSGKRKRSENTAPAQHAIKNRKWVGFLVKRPAISIVIILLLIGSVIYILPKLQTGFLPEMDEGSIVMDYSSPPGTSLMETDRMLREVEKLIVSVPEVQTYSRRTGTQMGFFITEPNTGDYLIQLKKDRTRTTDEVIESIRSMIESTQPALQIDFGQVIGDMLGDLMASVQPVEIKLYGQDKNVLNQISGDIAQVVEQVPGTADVFDGVVIAGPTISIHPDFTKIAQFGLTPDALQSQLQLALDGNESGTVYDKNQFTPIRAVYPGSRNLSIEQLNNVPVFLPSGGTVPLHSLATLSIQAGDAEVQRENLQNMGVVTARLENRDLGSVMNDIQQNISANIHLPIGYHIEYGGAYEAQQQSFRELLFILITAILLVFCVILFLFRDFKIALIIIGIAILGISGSYLALFITHTALNVGSYTGLIMIVGIIGENAIFTFLQFRDALHLRTVDEAIIFAISTRLRPKLMTALGAIIALSPIALGIGAGAQLHQPLAIAVIGGFIVALPLLLVVFPSILRIAYGKSSILGNKTV